ncbi:MAG TPA: TolC family protein [Bryobacteraceae bacterium]|nr:TolC family protein [Bryobacteraceae bacterium]
MQRICRSRHLCTTFLIAVSLTRLATAQQVFTWQQIRDRFIATNPTLKAGRIGIDESRADEVTAYLRPNPDATVGVDQLQPFTSNPYRPLAFALPIYSFSYLHERGHKRELRLESARQATDIAESQQQDLERTMVFTVRNTFVQLLQAKQVLALARETLAYYDNLLSINEARQKAGDIARVDLIRLKLQRVQFETDVQTALVNLRTAKIQLLTLLNDRTSVDQFDVTGTFDFTEDIPPLTRLRQMAADNRPDLKASVRTIEKAKTDHKLAIANGSTDPTFGVDVAHNPPLTFYFGVNVSIPLRIFDRNQGEKQKTLLDISRSERTRDATEAQVFGDVDSAYATLNSNLALLRPYKSDYLKQATEVRDIISYSYEHGGASLLDFLQAQSDYRSIQVAYLNLIGAFLTAGSQLDQAVGAEVVL